MRIAVDARCINRLHLRGIGRLLFEIIDRAHDLEFVLFGDRPDFPMHIPNSYKGEKRFIEEFGYRIHKWMQYDLPRAAIRNKCDILFCPANECPMVSFLPRVVVVHDTIRWKPEFQTGKISFYNSRVLPICIRNADQVITVSEFSAKEISKKFNLDNVQVIENGTSDAFLNHHTHQSSSLECSSDARRGSYVVYVGGAIERKRFSWAVDRWMPFSFETKMLVFGISSVEAEKWKRRIPSKVFQNLEFVPFLSDFEMANVIANAKCVIYPTLYEGFGLPVIEANAVGTPILHSRCGSLSEIVGPLSRTLEPYDVSAWDEAINKAIHYAVSNEEKVAGRDWSGRFSWDIAAIRYESQFKSLIDSRRV